MTIREQILQQIKIDLSKITSANGFTHDVSENMIFSGLKSLDDISVLPAISVVLGPEQSELTEYGLETELMVLIITKFSTETDVNKQGLVTEEAEKWFGDFEKLFSSPAVYGVDLNAISGLWNIDSPEGGVENYFISSKDPFADDLKDNRQTILTELTISLINTNS